MRITFLQREANFSGGNRMIAAYAHYLMKEGHEVLVVSARPPRAKPARRVLDTIRGVERYPGDGRSWLDETDIEHRVVSPPIDGGDVPAGDVVVATWWETAEWATKLPPRCGAPAYFIQGAEWTISGVPALRAKQTWRLPLHKIVVADFLADIASVEFGDDDVSLVPNGFDPTLFFAQPRAKSPSPTLGLMTVGDLPAKGWDVTHAALLRAKERLPSLRGYAFGRHPAPASHPLPDWIEFEQSPSPEALRAIYSRCDVFVHGARIEGYGLPVLEALACRTPVAATRAGAVPELLRSGCGIAVDIEDSDALADAVVTIASEAPAAWRRRSDMAADTAAANTLHRACRRMEQALERAADKRRRGAYSQASGERRSSPSRPAAFEGESWPFEHWRIDFGGGETPERRDLVHPLFLAQLEAETGLPRLLVDPLARSEGPEAHPRQPDFARELAYGSEVSYAEPPLRRVLTLFVSIDGEAKTLRFRSPSSQEDVERSAVAFVVPTRLDAPFAVPSPSAWRRIHYYTADCVEGDHDERRYFPKSDTSIRDRVLIRALNAAESAQAGAKEIMRRFKDRHLGVE